ncbi:LytTR family DNA-binding domain-containing protein [Fulvivirga maritima]|uniref:LytR/AlgR family response regulator transcription factor n=1 Tax=Fulvivirga maritima TaxID=2904247 RepID=UPI001F3C2113|nr:LytTR family DNA-binding domain-containing protein [Fulvivirga maritima]UII25594.1 LytTR family DNA-binding domain-containing protein [Fulvivirga maritima]
MKIVIIEDERLTAEDLASTIVKIDSSLEISAKILSVKDGIEYFQHNEEPDLIFSDIQLGDGLSFDIFKKCQINAPVIFCTAYNEYALEAFRANGIDYLLKPFTVASVSAALDKFSRLTEVSPAKNIDTHSILELFQNQQGIQLPASILVHYQDKIIPVKTKDIAVFYLHEGAVCLVTFQKKSYTTRKSLEELENTLGPEFFRANRQSIIHRESIIDVSNHLGRRLWVNVKVPVKESITISKEKTPLFLKWLSGG